MNQDYNIRLCLLKILIIKTKKIIMLKSILDTVNVRSISKKEQKNINGGSGIYLCDNECIFGLRLCYLTKYETFYQPC